MWPLYFILGFGLLVVGIIAFWEHNAEKARKAAIRAKLESLGFRVVSSTSIIPGIPELLGNLPWLRNGTNGVIWSAIAAPPSGLHMLLLEHRFYFRPGRRRTPQRHTVAAVFSPSDWQRITLLPESFLHRMGDSVGLTKDINIDNEIFDRRWRIRCENDNSTALLVLTPEVQAVLLNAPTDESWSIGRGTLACCWKRRLKDTELDGLLQRLSQVVQALNPEVRAMLEDAARQA